MLLPLAGECMFCPAADHAPATNTFTDSKGYVYRLCPRHYEPLRAWQLRGSPSGKALRGGSRILGLKERSGALTHG